MIDTALKEWKLVCDLLLTGELALLLRKGGIHEVGGPGEFSVEYDRFALYPTFDHQNPDMLKPRYAKRLTSDPDPKRIAIDGYAEVVKVWAVPSRPAFERLDDLHPWSSEYLDMRFGYRPDRPLYLVALRAYRLAHPTTIRYRAAYAGCKSWVPLDGDDRIDPEGATPAMDAPTLRHTIERIDAAFAQLS